MKRYYNYLLYVLRHKWFVYKAGRGLGVGFWRLVFHDWDKFLPSMFISYARTFYKPDGSKQYIESLEFTTAWNAHQKRNKHHWQYWLITWDRGETQALPMPRVDLQEMVADWIGAGRAITGKEWGVFEWYEANKNKMILHDETRKELEQYLHSIKLALQNGWL